MKYTVYFSILCFTSTFCFSQPALTITSPGDISLEDPVQVANFGPSTAIPVEGELIDLDADLACIPIAQDLTDQIAMITRGSCNFSLKVYHAQLQGAVGALICSYDNEIFPMAPGDSAHLVTIPSLFLADSTCNKLRFFLQDSSLTALIHFETPHEEPIIWGDSIDNGHFGFGLNGWTTIGISDPEDIWQYVPFRTRLGTCANHYFSSPSEANGMAYFSGEPYVPNKVCGDDLLNPTKSELISPAIDLSQHVDISLRFFSFDLPIGVNEDINKLSWSSDNGEHWSEPLIIPSESSQSMIGITIVNPESHQIPIPEAAGVDSFRFKFTYDRTRRYYFWAIDDVFLIQSTGCNDSTAHNYDVNADYPRDCETCFDGVLNGDEVRVDCGGSKCADCPPIFGCVDSFAHNYDINAELDDCSCETCFDGILNGDEVKVDCGGQICDECPPSNIAFTHNIIGFLDSMISYTATTVKNTEFDTLVTSLTISYYQSLDDQLDPLEDELIIENTSNLVLNPKHEFTVFIAINQSHSICSLPFIIGNVTIDSQYVEYNYLDNKYVDYIGNSADCVCQTTVSTTREYGPGSIKHAIECSDPGDTIYFESNLKNDTIKLLHTGLQFKEDLTLVANPNDSIYIDASLVSFFIEVSENNIVSLNNLSVLTPILCPVDAIQNYGTLNCNNVKLIEVHEGVHGIQILSNGFFR